MEEKLYYIQNGYVGNAILWWGIDSKGYTTDLDKAGRYTYDEMVARTKRRRDIGWECEHVDNNLDAKKIVVDAQYLDNDYRFEDNLT